MKTQHLDKHIYIEYNKLKAYKTYSKGRNEHSFGCIYIAHQSMGYTRT